MNFPAKLNALTNPNIFSHAYFPERRSIAFHTTLKIAKSATVFAARKEGEKTGYIVGFAKTARDARLCRLFLEAIRLTRGYVVFFGGRPEKVDWRLINVVDCYARALSVKNREAYCHIESDRLFNKPFHGALIDPETLKHEDVGDPGPDITAICPCRDIEGFLFLSKRSKHSLVDQISAVAEQKKQTHCPLFDATAFRELIREAPKYW